MLDILQELRRIQPRTAKRYLRSPIAGVGNRLIHFYYRTDSLEVRQLIREFMAEAGFDWTKKLITKDTSEAPAQLKFTGLTEYTRLAAANDPRAQWFRTG